MSPAAAFKTLAAVGLPPAVQDAQRIFEQEWNGFLRRGFYVENALDPIDLPGINDSTVRLVLRKAAAQRRIMFVQSYAPRDGREFAIGPGDETRMGHWIIDVPRQKRAQTLIAMLNLIVPTDAPGWGNRPHRDAQAPLKVWRTSMDARDPRCAAVWTAITRALATNNDIRSQMGLPLFTGGVTERVAA